MNDNEKWTVEKLTFGKDPLEIHETSSLSIIGIIMRKHSSAAFVGTIFCASCRMGFCHFLCDVAFRPCFHAYVISVYYVDAVVNQANMYVVILSYFFTFLLQLQNHQKKQRKVRCVCTE